MYNGIGLTTARGSGTSGYVQSNKFHRQQSRLKREQFEDLKKIHQGHKGGKEGISKREGNADILEHNKKRKIEVRLVEFRDALEEEGKLSENEIESKVKDERERLLRKMKQEDEEHEQRRGFKRNRDMENEENTHEIAERQRQKMANLRTAVGISRDDDEKREGEAFDRELQQQLKEEKQRKRKSRRPLMRPAVAKSLTRSTANTSKKRRLN